jgi:hypothetical protein
MKTRSYTLSVDSTTVFKFQAVGDDGDRPRLVTFNNDGIIGMYIRWVNIDEGTGDEDDKFYLAPGAVKTIQVEGSELSINKIGAILATSAPAQSLEISATNYQNNPTA